MPRRNKHGGKRVGPKQDQVHAVFVLNRDARIKNFKAECAYQRFCQHPNCENPGSWKWEAHHVTYEQTITKEYTTDPDTVWHPDNALRLCVDCHKGRQHNRKDPVPVSALRSENIEFAVVLMGPGKAYEYLRRYYAGTDQRLEALVV